MAGPTVTGEQPLPVVVIAATYEHQGYPWFDICSDEKSLIFFRTRRLFPRSTSTMRAINKKATKILTKLIEGMAPGTSRKIANSDVYMPLSVERLSEDRFSMAHYYSQCGDLVPDPDMEFWRGPDGKFYPVAIQMNTGYYQRAIDFGQGGAVEGYYPRAQREQAVFAAHWLSNIKEQQGV
jgi:hypothetical protein